MVAIKTGEIGSWLTARPKGVAVALFYGPDGGLVQERARRLSHYIVEDVNDPFNAISLSEGDIESVGQLADEAMALSFMGGERLIRLRTPGEKAAKGVTHLLTRIEAGAAPNALVVIEAGDLKKTSALRKACEKSRFAAAIGCYPQEGKDLAETIRTRLKQESLSIDDAALLRLVTLMGDDHGVLSSELEKLILYMGPQSLRAGTAEVTETDIAQALAQSTADATFEIADLTLRGDSPTLSEALFRARGAGVSLLGVLRILQGRLARLMTVKEAEAAGRPRADAMKSVRPPIFYGEQRAFTALLEKWSLRDLERAAMTLLEADLAAKQTGVPATEVIERTLFRLARLAQRPG
ncbi:hypothetical protein PB2503_04692 [Parvularcula bermudensis HTCC2503]|uniref:DNA-directed DNA polymerase n=1 Tax=Parvularcula bermudensis (strain ATCC BAA-594 / HTCC2503 / KCTC 12087) TaxID=314260 RepID=E0TF95_PARBH|nr:DNA polymerase III subunit delta [Parvularcula bermudensis]ADM09013.1 hypothetical protein PB2503_04692 [Parvularcula bermudensis HTCC2503]